MDFTINNYIHLLKTLKNSKYTFLTFKEYLELNNVETLNDNSRRIILRHDVDLLPQNSLKFAQIQYKLGIKGSYYFRAVPESWDESIIKEIASLGHEIGYHYETMDTAKGDIDLAWNQFKLHLKELRDLVEVSTVCMHGSPKSKYDNKEIWGKYSYSSVDIIGEPYYDVNFDELFYLTDTGRRWDGWKVSVRDKVPQQKEWIKKGLVFRSTVDIIDSVKEGVFPDQIMFTFHPQRWHDNYFYWVKELIFQNLKNLVKKYLIVK